MRSEIKILASELASPLATSRSALAMLLAGDLGELGDRQREYIQHVMQLDDYMIGLLGSWVDMERLSKGQVALEVEPCNIGSALKNVANDTVELHRQKQWPMVLADPLRLRQIIINILSVCVSAVIRARTTSEFCILTFQDMHQSDPKIRAAALDALRSDAPTSLISLRIARLLAEAHGGSLLLNAHTAGGLRLHLKMPLAKQMSLLGEQLS